MDTFQERITALFREAKNANYRLNQKEFALRFGASRSQLKGWLSGAGAPSTSMLRTIAKECNVSADWLIGGTDIRTPAEEVVKRFGQNPAQISGHNSGLSCTQTSAHSSAHPFGHSSEPTSGHISGQPSAYLEQAGNMPDLAGSNIFQDENVKNFTSKELQLLEQYRLMDKGHQDILQRLADIMGSLHKHQ